MTSKVDEINTRLKSQQLSCSHSPPENLDSKSCPSTSNNFKETDNCPNSLEAMKIDLTSTLSGIMAHEFMSYFETVDHTLQCSLCSSYDQRVAVISPGSSGLKTSKNISIPSLDRGENGKQTREFLNFKKSLKRHLASEKHVRAEKSLTAKDREDRVFKRRDDLTSYNFGTLVYCMVKNKDSYRYEIFPSHNSSVKTLNTELNSKDKRYSTIIVFCF